MRRQGGGEIEPAEIGAWNRLGNLGGADISPRVSGFSLLLIKQGNRPKVQGKPAFTHYCLNVRIRVVRGPSLDPEEGRVR